MKSGGQGQKECDIMVMGGWVTTYSDQSCIFSWCQEGTPATSPGSTTLHCVSAKAEPPGLFQSHKDKVRG